MLKLMIFLSLLGLSTLVQAESEITVMVIDTGIGKNDHLNGIVQYDGSDQYQDETDHGTHVTGIIVYGNKIFDGKKANFEDRLCENVKIISCRYYISETNEAENQTSLHKEIECIKKASKLKIDYVNFSGFGDTFSGDEYESIKTYTESGGIMVVAAGNKSSNLANVQYFPASYAFPDFSDKKFKPLNLYVVENVDSKGIPVPTSNYRDGAYKAEGSNIFSTEPDNTFGFHTGTSQAAPALLHLMLKQKCIDLGEKSRYLAHTK